MRLDVFLCTQGLFPSRTKAAEAVARGLVLVNGKKAKAGAEVNIGSDIRVIEGRRFVSNGGYKLDKALEDFGFDVKGLVFADIGASTGGFTDGLLQRGAAKVYAVDVGEDQLDESLKGPRVVVMDRTNARSLKKNSFPEPLDGAVVDCSFISLKLILESVGNILSEDREIVALIKPQFECEERRRFKNGIVKDGKLRKQIVEKLYCFCVEKGFTVTDFTSAPVVEGKNREYLIRLKKGGAVSKPLSHILNKGI